VRLSAAVTKKKRDNCKFCFGSSSENADQDDPFIPFPTKNMEREEQQQKGQDTGRTDSGKIGSNQSQDDRGANRGSNQESQRGNQSK